jgi:fatty acid desaturase
VAWQTSLQHEVVHGHPTPWPWVNRLIAGPPLLLWVPFDRYRDCHLAHHIDERLTDPLDDPESWYVTAEAWDRSPAPIRWLRIVMNTFLGRIVLGPLWLVGRALAAEAGDAIHGRRLGAVVGHAALIVIILAVLHRTGFPVWAYGLMVVWPASALLAIRSFAEHRPHDDPAARSLIVENGGPLALLFLGNNLHAVHHARPGLPWYLLKGVFADSRIDVLRRNQNYRFVSYASIIVRYLIVPRDHPIHPRDRG